MREPCRHAAKPPYPGRRKAYAMRSEVDDFRTAAARARVSVEHGPGGLRDLRLAVDGRPLEASAHMIVSDGLTFVLGETCASDDRVLRGEHDAPIIALHVLLRGSATLEIDGLDARIGE